MLLAHLHLHPLAHQPHHLGRVSKAWPSTTASSQPTSTPVRAHKNSNEPAKPTAGGGYSGSASPSQTPQVLSLEPLHQPLYPPQPSNPKTNPPSPPSLTLRRLHKKPSSCARQVTTSHPQTKAESAAGHASSATWAVRPRRNWARPARRIQRLRNWSRGLGWMRGGMWRDCCG